MSKLINKINKISKIGDKPGFYNYYGTPINFNQADFKHHHIVTSESRRFLTMRDFFKKNILAYNTINDNIILRAAMRVKRTKYFFNTDKSYERYIFVTTGIINYRDTTENAIMIHYPSDTDKQLDDIVDVVSTSPEWFSSRNSLKITHFMPL